MKPLVSIITPSYNQGKYIRETIESVLSQDYDNIEYIIIDGGSNDETLKILAEYEGQLQYVSEKDNGQSDAINKGFKMAHGDILAWINSDDKYEPGAVSAAVEVFNNNPNIGLLYGHGNIIDEYSNVVKQFEYTRSFDLWELVYVWDYIMQPTTFFRAEALKKVGFLDSNLFWTMDWDLWIRLALQYDVFFLDKVLACSREYADTKTSTGGMKRIHEISSLLYKYSNEKEPYGYNIYYTSELLQQNIMDGHLVAKYNDSLTELLENIPTSKNGYFEGTEFNYACRKTKDVIYLNIFELNKKVSIYALNNKKMYSKFELEPGKKYSLPIPSSSETLNIISLKFDTKVSMQVNISSRPAAESEIKKVKWKKIHPFNKKKIMMYWRNINAIQVQQLIISPVIGLDFSKEQVYDLVQMDNWNASEADGIWSKAKSEIEFSFDTAFEYEVRIEFNKLLDDESVSIEYNGNKVFACSPNRTCVCEFLLNKESHNKQGMQKLSFTVEGATSPFELNKSEDRRELGIFLKKIIINKI